MPDQTTPLVPGFSVKDLADPETIRERALRLSGAVTAEQASENFRAAARKLGAAWTIGVPHPSPAAVREAIRREEAAVYEAQEADDA